MSSPGEARARARGRLVAAVGLLADVAAGLALLAGWSRLGLLLHLPATLVWAHGMAMLAGGGLPGDARAIVARVARRAPGDAPSPGGRAMAGLLLGLLLFPGFGTIAWSLAAGLAARPPRRRMVQAVAAPVATRPRPRDEALDPLLDLELHPLADIVRGTDAQFKRPAIILLKRQPDRDAVRLIRQLLTDPDPDVRSEAAVALFQIEGDLDRAVKWATALTTAAPEVPDHYAALAALYRRYVGEGLVDEGSGQFYLAQAADALGRATALAPERGDLWAALARTCSERGDHAGAAAALERATALDPDNAEVRLLEMEVAYAARRWDELAAIARRGGPSAPGASDQEGLREWWAGASPAAETGGT